MAGTSMRTAEHQNAKPVAGASHPMAPPAMKGGKKRRTLKAKKSKARRHSKSMRHKSVKRGGMGAGFGAVIKEAIVPFGLFAWQKKSQKRHDSKRRFNSSKSYKKR
jgi:hypothetical protein